MDDDYDIYRLRQNNCSSPSSYNVYVYIYTCASYLYILKYTRECISDMICTYVCMHFTCIYKAEKSCLFLHIGNIFNEVDDSFIASEAVKLKSYHNVAHFPHATTMTAKMAPHVCTPYMHVCVCVYVYVCVCMYVYVCGWM